MDCAAPKLSPPELAAQVGEQEISWQEKKCLLPGGTGRETLIPSPWDQMFQIVDLQIWGH